MQSKVFQHYLPQIFENMKTPKYLKMRTRVSKKWGLKSRHHNVLPLSWVCLDCPESSLPCLPRLEAVAYVVGTYVTLGEVPTFESSIVSSHRCLSRTPMRKARDGCVKRSQCLPSTPLPHQKSAKVSLRFLPGSSSSTVN